MLRKQLQPLLALDGPALIEDRYRKFRAMGPFTVAG